MKNRVRLHSNNYVVCWSETLAVHFYFSSQEKAEAFVAAAIRSHSITGVSLFLGGKYSGSRDGEGS